MLLHHRHRVLFARFCWISSQRRCFLFFFVCSFIPSDVSSILLDDDDWLVQKRTNHPRRMYETQRHIHTKHNAQAPIGDTRKTHNEINKQTLFAHCLCRIESSIPSLQPIFKGRKSNASTPPVKPRLSTWLKASRGVQHFTIKNETC